MSETINTLEDTKTEETVYSKLDEMVEETFRISKQVEEERDEGLEGMEYYKALTKEILKENKGVLFTIFLFSIVVIHLVMTGIHCIQFLLLLNADVLQHNLIVFFFWIIFPVLLWAWSTKYEMFIFWNRKFILLVLCLVNAAIQLVELLLIILSGILFPIFARLPETPDISLSMLCNLLRLILFVCSVIPVALGFRLIFKEITNPLTLKEIYGFKLTKLYDGRKDKKYLYDMKIVKNLETGRVHVIEEKDRFLHSLANGVTGTGKTSMCFTTSINSDLEQIVFNMVEQKKDCEKLLQEGKIKLVRPLKDNEFNIDAFCGVTEEYDKVLEEIKFKKRVAGITAIAPDASFSDEIYELAHSKGLSVNRIDPLLGDDGFLKPGFRGFNPLHITDGLNEIEFIIEASRKSILFADVLQALYDYEGSSDVYFASLNKNVTTTLSMLLEFTFKRLRGRQPNAEDVQQILNSFKTVTPFRNEFVDIYGKRDNKGNLVYEDGHYVMIRTIFQTILDVIDNELLGDGAETMNGQCRGLRVIMNTLLTNLNVANVLCNEDSVDMDKALARGEITVVNFALELGSSGKALGLFYMLNFINAAYRRPGNEDTRIPNFCYIDELPQLLHPSIEQCFVLFRKYRIAMFVAIQSLSQMSKVASTAFLQQILIGNCAHHFVFGRSSVEEMELYEKLAGKSLKITNMEQVSESSITADNPNITYGSRQQMSMENQVEGGQIHERDFQEVTVVTVRKGSPVGMFFGKTAFLPRYKRTIKRKLYSVNWSKYYDGNETDIKEDIPVKNKIKQIVEVTSNDQFEKKDNNVQKGIAPAFMSQLSSVSARHDDLVEEQVNLEQENKPGNENLSVNTDLSEDIRKVEERKEDTKEDNGFGFTI